MQIPRAYCIIKRGMGGLQLLGGKKPATGLRMLCAEHAYFANEFFYTEMEDGEIIFG